MKRFLAGSVLAAAVLVGGAGAWAGEAAAPAAGQKQVPQQTTWKSFITPAQLKAEQTKDTKLVVIDVRKPDKYAAGHIPGAINLPGHLWRTEEAKPGEGQAQYIFRDADNQPDIARYEKLLGEVGISRDQHIVIYGNYAGKADGSVPAMLLVWLGQEKVAFLDGVGLDRWKAAGFETTTAPKTLAAAKYEAKPQAHFVWQLSDVLKNLHNKDVLFYDSRAPKEYTGEDKRDNARGGHIPGAVLCNFTEFLDSKNHTTLSPEQIKAKLAERHITPDKQIVLYCQTATRVSLPLLALRDLGYKHVAIYDASWFEYGNRADTPIEVETKTAPAQPAVAEGNGQVK